MILIGDIASFKWKKNVLSIGLPTNGLITCTAIFLLNSHMCVAQIDQVLEAGRTRNKIKTQTTFQHNYRGVASAAPEFKLGYAEYNSEGKKTAEKTFDDAPSIVKRYRAQYNDNDKPVKEVWTTQFTDSVTYKYDPANGLLTEERWYWGEDKAKSKIVHTYDEAGNMVCTAGQYDYGQLVDSMFYANGHLALTKTYDENGHLSSNLTNIYDNQGHLIEEIKTNEDGEMMQKVSRMYYETGLLKTIQTSYYSTGEGKSKKDIIYGQLIENYKYDKGLPREQSIVSTNNNEKVSNTIATYTFDEKGLLTELATVNVLSKEKTVLRYVYTFNLN